MIGGSKHAGRTGKVLSFTAGVFGERVSARLDFTGDGQRDVGAPGPLPRHGRLFVIMLMHIDVGIKANELVCLLP